MRTTIVFRRMRRHLAAISRGAFPEPCRDHGLKVAQIALVVCATILPMSAYSNTLTQAEYVQFNKLTRQMLDLDKDLGAATKLVDSAPPGALRTRTCISDIRNSLGRLVSFSHSAGTLIYLSANMDSPGDEALINSEIERDISYGLEILETERDAVGTTSGYCAGSALIAARSSDATGMMSQLANLLSQIRQKLSKNGK